MSGSKDINLGSRISDQAYTKQRYKNELREMRQNIHKKKDVNTQKINTIRKIKTGDGMVLTDIKEISMAFVGFYQELFTAGPTQGVDTCLADMEPCVTDAMNVDLLKPFVAEEVVMALGQMHPLKSPGPDGFSACFYQRSWDTVKKEVCKSVLDFLNHGIFDPSINCTHIALVPKTKSPISLTDYCPISLCNVLYKFSAKVLANRLKKVLPHIISPNQSAFILGRLITDNIMVAFEATHTMDKRMKGREGYMALKLDMSKAFDRVEWGFLEAVMQKLGFDARWIHLLMTCVRTVSYSVLINGQPFGNITPSRGIRQGDPLSPYFFILCAEGLSSLLHKAERDRRITGLPIVRGGMRLNHLFFADDSLLFCKANIPEWINVQDILAIYERASGQKLNKEKTSISFSRNTKLETKQHILSVAGVKSTNQFERYLGLPALIGSSKVEAFSGLQGKIWGRINGWKEKFLSQAGKEVLLKAVIQSIPTYTMSVFQLPKSVCKDINSMMSNFWWGQKEKEAKIAWMSWEKLGRPKEKGGMGYRDLESFNLALLAKQGWRLFKHPESLVARVFKQKYFPNDSFLNSSLGRNPSYVWRSVWNAKRLLNDGLIWRVGNGDSIKI
jgi:hypothetical protein